MLLSLYFPVTCNPSDAVTLLHIGVPHRSEFPTELPTHTGRGCDGHVKRLNHFEEVERFDQSDNSGRGDLGGAGAVWGGARARVAVPPPPRA